MIARLDPQAIKQALSKYPAIDLAILFGSLANGTARMESDLDLAVAADHALQAEEKMAMITDLADVFGRPIDLIDLSTAGEPLLGEILGSGKFVLKNQIRYARVLSRHLFEQADFMPYRQRVLQERRSAWLGA